MSADSTEISATPTAPVIRVARLGTRRLTRAHLALAQRPAICAELAAGAAPVARALGEQLGCAVSFSCRLLEASFVPKFVLPRSAAYAVFELGAVGAVAALEIELGFLVAVAGRLSGGEVRVGPATALTRIEEAAFGFLCLVAVAAARGVPAYERLAPRLVDVRAERAEVLERLEGREPHLGIELRMDVGGQVGIARLLVPAGVLQASLQEAPPELPPELPPEIAVAALSATALAGASHLTPDDLRSLGPGDVVVFDALHLAEGEVHGRARLVTATFELDGELGPNGFTLTRAVPRAFPQEPPMQVAPIRVDSPPPLPVEVEVELTRLRLALSELAALKPGALLALHVSSADPVVLRVGDRAVARAELVQIDGEVGARILALLP
jgi:type III secretion protein Q